jgi:hypothetical protein
MNKLVSSLIAGVVAMSAFAAAPVVSAQPMPANGSAPTMTPTGKAIKNPEKHAAKKANKKAHKRAAKSASRAAAKSAAKAP